jgi:hypothetical protein
MRLALYAHYSSEPTVARHVQHHLQHLRGLDFKICFITNSPISAASAFQLRDVCDRIVQRENTGYDFSMWQAGLEQYDLSAIDELLLTNASIIGPLWPLEPLWQNPLVNQCDFWGLTDNCDTCHHLQSFFLVFRRAVIQTECFARFWSAILPYTDKAQVIRSYEMGLTSWLEQHGFKWKTQFPQAETWKAYLEFKGREKLRRGMKDVVKQFLPAWRNRSPAFSQEHIWRKYLGDDALSPGAEYYLRMRGLPGLDTTLYYPEMLIEAGMPYLKAALLKAGNQYHSPHYAFALLKGRAMPQDALDELNPVENEEKFAATAVARK